MAYSGIWDGFDDYDNTHDGVWNFVQNTNGNTVLYSSAYARFPAAPGCIAQGMKIGFSSYKRKNLTGNFPTYMHSFAIYFPALPNSGTLAFIRWEDNGSAQCYLGVGSNGALIAHNGGGGIIGQTGPGVITSAAYYFIDIITTINNLTGSMQVFLSTALGGAALLTLSNVNTRGTFNNYCNQFSIGDVFNTGNFMWFDDFHSHDSAGGTPNTILGEGSRIYTKMPNGAGAFANWTPNGAVSNYQCVNPAPTWTDDNQYVSASTAIEDGYGVGTAGFSGVVNGLVRRSRVRKDDAGAHTFQNGVRSSGNDQLGTAQAVLSGYGPIESFLGIDPHTGAAWLAAAADAAQPIIFETT